MRHSAPRTRALQALQSRLRLRAGELTASRVALHFPTRTAKGSQHGRGALHRGQLSPASGWEPASLGPLAGARALEAALRLALERAAELA